MVTTALERDELKLAISHRRTRALVIINAKDLNYRVVDCSRKLFCRVHVSKSCPSYCPVIVAAKDFATGRREPKAKITLLK